MKNEKRIRPRSFIALLINVSVPMEHETGWNEDTYLKDISGTGAGFTLNRSVKRGQPIFLTIPMPNELRYYDFNSEKYQVWGIVTRCIEVNRLDVDQHYALGVAFIGKSPPPYYHLYPGRLYEISDDPPEENGFWKVSKDDLMDDERDVTDDERRPTRLSIPEALTIEIIDDNGRVLTSETTFTENISLRGAAVFSQLLYVEVGSFLRVKSKLHNVTLISIVRGKRVGTDGINRLHIEFIDRWFPLPDLE